MDSKALGCERCGQLAGRHFVASYSGGKDSVLAIHRALRAGMVLDALLITRNVDRGRSWFHGIPDGVLDLVQEAVGVPVVRVTTDGEHYSARFEEMLLEFAEKGVEACVFGDIDLQGHRDWGEARCRAAGIESVFPLWQEDRKDLVFEGLAEGYTSTITVVDGKRLDESFAGVLLTKEVIARIEACGADACGENGEYHTFTHGGPLFKGMLDISFGSPLKVDSYTVAPLIRAGVSEIVEG